MLCILTDHLCVCVSPTSPIQGMAIYSFLLGSEQLVLLVRQKLVRETLALFSRWCRYGKLVLQRLITIVCPRSFFIFYPLQFNATNPAGNVVESERYLHFLAIGVGVGFIVATKRFWLGLLLGRQTFCKYTYPTFERARSAKIGSHVLTLAIYFHECSAVC